VRRPVGPPAGGLFFDLPDLGSRRAASRPVRKFSRLHVIVRDTRWNFAMYRRWDPFRDTPLGPFLVKSVRYFQHGFAKPLTPFDRKILSVIVVISAIIAFFASGWITSDESGLTRIFVRHFLRSTIFFAAVMAQVTVGVALGVF
jgi:hypothetical protein